MRVANRILLCFLCHTTVECKTFQRTGVAGIDNALFRDDAATYYKYVFTMEVGTISKEYNINDLRNVLVKVYKNSIAGRTFYLGNPKDSEEKRLVAAQVNLAAFIAQAMQDSIIYDACDENNWMNAAVATANGRSGAHPLDTACGQLNKDYADRSCDLECPRVPRKQISGRTHAFWGGAPPPLFCAPDDVLEAKFKSTSGRWNPHAACKASADEGDQVWQKDGCKLYDGQTSGAFDWTPLKKPDGTPYSLEGCCWWGRGVIQPKGRCSFGMLNHYVGKTHVSGTTDPPRPDEDDVLYKDIDFCDNPQAVCDTDKPELKWVAGYFFWLTEVQTYVGHEDTEWIYIDELHKFIDGGMTDDSFIDAVSGITVRGCHKDPCCGEGIEHRKSQRRESFNTVLRLLKDAADGALPPEEGNDGMPGATLPHPTGPPTRTCDGDVPSTFPWLAVLLSLFAIAALILGCCLFFVVKKKKNNEEEGEVVQNFKSNFQSSPTGGRSQARRHQEYSSAIE